MFRGTTPTYTFTLPDDVEMSAVTDMYVTFAQMNETIIMTKSGADLSISGNDVSVYLTQAETLAFPNGQVKVQLNWLYTQGNLTKRACSNIMTIKAVKNLINEEIE